MDLADAIQLIANLHHDTSRAESWADLGCGSGLFTCALANLLPPESIIYAVDKAPVTLHRQPFPENRSILTRQLDFETDGLPFHNLDGILMANALHYVGDKASFLEKAKASLKETGRFLIVEYDTNVPNPWVPFPVKFSELGNLFKKTGFKTVQKLGERLSIYGRAKLYAAIIAPE